jgi:O-antigen/teichoic acid export membrane protein
MLISLYTVRVVLAVLGVEDFGVYNVVAGIVTMFGFLSNSMSFSAQRFFSYELAKKDPERLQKVFNVSLSIYMLIGLLIFLLMETVGLWFFSNVLKIPHDRIIAASWVYQSAIISFMFTILASPHMALILSHEDMNIYAVLSLVKSIMNLIVVIFLQFIVWDKLKLYGALMCIASIIDAVNYRIICNIKYPESKFRLMFDKALFKEIITYNNWNLLAVFATIFRNQIINVLLNQIFNPVIVGARSVSMQVNTAVSSFFSGFNMSLRPPIVKYYAVNEMEKMNELIFVGTKITFLLMYILILPLFLEMPALLSLWLKNVPEYAVLFSRITLFDVFIWSINYPIDAAAMATNKIKWYTLAFAISMMLNFPLSWLVLLLGAPVYSVMIISVILSFMAFSLRFIIVRKLIGFPSRVFLKAVILPLAMVTIGSPIIPVVVFSIMEQGFIRLCIVTALSILSVGSGVYFIALSSSERKLVRNVVINRMKS